MRVDANPDLLVSRSGGVYYIAEYEIAEYAPRLRRRRPAWGVVLPAEKEPSRYFRTRGEAFSYVVGVLDASEAGLP